MYLNLHGCNYIFLFSHIRSTIQALDLRSWSWSKIEAKAGAESLESPSPVTVTARAGHSLVSII